LGRLHTQNRLQLSGYSQPVSLGDGEQAREDIHARSSARSSLQYLDELVPLQILEDLCPAYPRDRCLHNILYAAEHCTVEYLGRAHSGDASGAGLACSLTGRQSKTSILSRKLKITPRSGRHRASSARTCWGLVVVDTYQSPEKLCHTALERKQTSSLDSSCGGHARPQLPTATSSPTPNHPLTASRTPQTNRKSRIYMAKVYK